MSTNSTKTAKAKPANFLLLPRELRQCILLLTHEVDVPILQYKHNLHVRAPDRETIQAHNTMRSWAALSREVDPIVAADMKFVQEKWEEPFDVINRALMKKFGGLF
ncbi:hypothetical protein FKW77_002996 [Venturia effusa]|uniref:Uncharacterized protein n=1 Tax=Venturia effusa TaxID=50376 RepID=A0A517LMH8_9PEZI|nr:hypothetical protein FKW77_002996 [Venturia effusa]